MDNNEYRSRMIKELVIDVKKDQVAIALLEDKALVELTRESLKQTFAVGNIYLGRVKKIMAGLNAAFVDIGCEKEAFIHYHDLGTQFATINDYVQQILNDRKHAPKLHHMPDLDKEANISSVLTVGQNIVVQVVKEPISTKGPRLTGELSLAGRNMVLLPLSDNKVSISLKIKKSEERVRLRQLLQSIKPQNCGVIVRTVAESKRVAELDGEMRILQHRWEQLMTNLRSSQGIALLLEEIGRSVAILRDHFNPEFESIHVNDQTAYNELLQYVQMIAPERQEIVKFYNEEIPIFDHFAITKQIKSLLGRTVSFKRGAYLILDQTEAMFVIDVNSGTRTRASQGQEENALEVNMLAATEIARQLRLRDIGGIIVIDFIDMNNKANQQKLYEHMQQLLASDTARHNILPLSKFCLMQITRQRVRPAMEVNTQETCPTCFGTGKARPAILFTDQLEEKIDIIVNTLKINRFTLCVHPFIAAYINQGLWSQKRCWQWQYAHGLRIMAMQELGFLQYKFIDPKGQEIKPELVHTDA